MSCNENDIKLPGDYAIWRVDSDDLVVQSSMKITQLGGSEDADLTQRLNAGRAVALKKKQTRQAEVSDG